MPAYNEADGIDGFIREIHGHLVRECDHLDIVVADDRSTDDTARVVAGLQLESVSVLTQPANRGHGPTALAAYRAGLATGAEVIVHVDGDGQFAGADIARVARALVQTGAAAVHGVRQGRNDPWYRRMISGSLRVIVRPFAGRAIPDINTPLRAYRRPVASRLIQGVGTDAQVPHVHFSLIEARAGLDVRYVRVQSLPRRGATSTGTMWGTGALLTLLPPQRLRSFVRLAFMELWQISLRPSAKSRDLARELRSIS
ncbi:glycosyltransferase family 2 protein [Microbacterium marinum]|uniref:glycosyltransferase family 2 protein n=1 Tax=Microbacterium marinum TaxID=421115 RepID=UPI0038503774